MKFIWYNEEGISDTEIFNLHSVAVVRAISIFIFLTFMITLSSLFKIAETDLNLHLPASKQEK